MLPNGYLETLRRACATGRGNCDVSAEAARPHDVHLALEGSSGCTGSGLGVAVLPGHDPKLWPVLPAVPGVAGQSLTHDRVSPLLSPVP